MNPSLLFHILFILFTVFTSKAFSLISYYDNCNSFAPEATPTSKMFTRFPFLEPVTSHYTGGQNILDQDPQSQRSILFKATRNIFRTNVVDTYKIQARLSFFSSYMYNPDPASTFTNIKPNYSREHPHTLVFDLDGFWSVSTSKLCMVGSARWSTKEGKPLKLNAVLKLKFYRFINLNNSLVSGTLESLASPNDFDYFNPISMLGFPRVATFKYKYTLVSNEECNVTKTVQDLVISMKSLDACSIFTQRFITYKLEYPSNCKNCSLFGQDHNGYLPTFMSLNGIQCSREDNKMRVLVEFQDRRFTRYDKSFQPSISLIGEGTWNGIKDELCIVACHILNQSDPLGSARVGDCSVRLSLWFPAVRSITKTHNTEGQIWSTNLKDDLGSFKMAKFKSFDHSRENYGMKYEYTQMERVRRICPKNKHVGNKYQRDEYQSGYHSFDMYVKHKNMVSPGFAVAMFVGSRGFNEYTIEAVSPTADVSTPTYSGPVNVSFEISFMLNISSVSRSGISSLNLSSTDDNRVEISAEGVHDDETGQVCMVGCRNLIKNSSFDCEILVKFQLPRGKQSLIKGNIESLREKRDVLYFESLDIVSYTLTETEARESMWRMDLEIIMVLISDTLTCVFIGRQLFHLKKTSEMVNSISVLMMLILTLGHMVPLVLNYEAIFSNTRKQQNVLIRNNGLVEVNEVIVRIVTMVAFVLQSRLLQLTWIAKKNHWIHEIRTLFICLPTYIISGLAMLLANWNNNSYTISSQHSIWRLLRGQRYISHQFDRLYIYANPRADFYSPSWDIVIVCGGLVLAVIVFLQQCFGGRFMFPKRFQEHVEYEMEFDQCYGLAWHCVTGKSFGSFVTYSPGGFVYFTVDSYSVLLFKTEILEIDIENGELGNVGG
ncbi:uncharacterized protein LOC143561339 [Bidens hawaiensis]|uniref:uncharacterized protein LOC143561339 n=1 Tax=Bidens hawaiensis TaxID=980011 RepID=UPI004049F308